MCAVMVTRSISGCVSLPEIASSFSLTSYHSTTCVATLPVLSSLNEYHYVVRSNDSRRATLEKKLILCYEQPMQLFAKNLVSSETNWL